MPTEENYTTILSSFRQKDNQIISDLIKSIDKQDLQSADSCISIGPGPGLIEIDFVHQCLPNLKKFTAVEPDPNCAAELQTNLDTLLSKRIETEIHREVAQLWKGPEHRVDVILVFHSLYYVDKPGRLDLLGKCLNSWLKPGGTMFVMMLKDVKDGEQHFMNEIYRLLEVPVLVEAQTIREEIGMLGFKTDKDYTYQYDKDMNTADEEFVDFLKYHIDKPVDSSVIKEAMHKVAPNGIGKCMGSLFSIKSKNLH